MSLFLSFFTCLILIGPVKKAIGRLKKNLTSVTAFGY